MNEFTLDYMDTHRAELKAKYADVKTFKKSFDAEKEMLEDFIAYAEKNDIERDEEGLNTSKELILIRLKALIARNLWDTSAYFEVANDLNDALNKAIETLNDNTFKKEKLVYK